MNVEERSEVIRGWIETAFANVPRPTRDEMAGSASIGELWCAKEFAGRPRDEVTINDALPECLLWMPPSAVQYYLPMFLLYLLNPKHRYESYILDSVIGYFDRRNRREYPQFSAMQRRCIMEWLEFVRDNHDAYDFGRLRDRYERRLNLIRDQWSAAS
ncbi:MAG: DUF6714 family protein [Isosphaeraceae bacterium]